MLAVVAACGISWGSVSLVQADDLEPTDAIPAESVDGAAEVTVQPEAHIEPEVFHNGLAPIRIRIPAINLDTQVIPVGTDSDGAMAAPDNPDLVAWYALGPGIGIGGNIVLAGHVDWEGRPRAFGRLRSLGQGDTVTIWDADGTAEQYVVESSEWVEADGAPVEEIFGHAPQPTVTLITCGGAYDPFSRQYLHRLVVRATLSN